MIRYRLASTSFGFDALGEKRDGQRRRAGQAGERQSRRHDRHTRKLFNEIKPRQRLGQKIPVGVGSAAGDVSGPDHLNVSGE
jgi:hypothetical protein